MINSNTHIKPNYQVILANLHYLITLQKKVIEFKDNLITAEIGNARIAKQKENIDSTELKRGNNRIAKKQQFYDSPRHKERSNMVF